MTLLLLVILAFTTWQGLNNPFVMEKYLFSTEAIRFRRQWIRLISPGFLHGSWQHFFGNALTLYFFAPVLESSRGGAEFVLLIFLGSIAGGHLLCMFLHKNGDYRAVGASGGALGLLFTAILIQPSIYIMFLPGWLYGFIFLFYTLSSLRGGSGVSHEAHLGGMLSGILLTLMRFPFLYAQQPLLVSALLLIAAGGIWYFHMNPGRVPGFLKFTFRNKVNDMKQTQSKRQSQQVDELLDKVSKQGIQSLSNRERQVLQNASRKRDTRR